MVYDLSSGNAVLYLQMVNLYNSVLHTVVVVVFCPVSKYIIYFNMHFVRSSYSYISETKLHLHLRTADH